MTYIASLEVAVFHDVLLSEIFKIWMQQRYLRSYALTWIICQHFRQQFDAIVAYAGEVFAKVSSLLPFGESHFEISQLG